MTGRYGPVDRASHFLFRCPALVTGVKNDAGTTDPMSSNNCMTTVDWYDGLHLAVAFLRLSEKSVAICLNASIGLASAGAMG